MSKNPCFPDQSKDHSSRVIGAGGSCFDRAYDLEVTPTTLEFDPTNVGESSSKQTIFIKNKGFRALTDISIEWSGTFAVQHSAPENLKSDDGFEIEVSFTPQFVGTSSGYIVIRCTEFNVAAVVHLQGWGTGEGAPTPEMANYLRLGQFDTPGQGSYRANGNRIQDLGVPVATTDAARKQDILEAVADLAVDGSGQFVVERLADASNPENGAAMVARNVIAVDSIADLLALPEGARRGDLRYLVRGYHAGSDVGGGVIGWYPDSTKTPDNGMVFAVPGVDPGRFERAFEGPLNVTWFGAVGDGVTDDTDAIQAALRCAYQMAPQTGWRSYTAEIHFSRGKYRVAKPNTLFAGLAAMSCKITGEGRQGITEIIYDPPSPASTDFLFNFSSIIVGFTQFHGILFSATAAVNNNFMDYYSVGSTQHFSFTECQIIGFYDIFNVRGPANASENLFLNCKIGGFSGVAFRLNNAQSVNWRFYATDIEGFSGTVFEFLQGATILVSQGSIIPTAETARIIKIPAGADSNAFGSGNGPQLVFHGSRFEMRSGSLMCEKLEATTSFNVKFDACGMGGFNIPDASLYKMFVWRGAGSIVLRDCKNLQKYRIDHEVLGNSAAYSQFIADNCDLPPDFISASHFAVTGASAVNEALSMLFDIRNCGRALDGMYHPFDTQYHRYGSIAPARRSVSWSSERRTLIITAGATRVAETPPVRLLKIELYPIAHTGYGSTATITVRNGDGSIVLATFTYNMGAPEQVVFAQDVNYYIDAKNGDQLQVEFQNSSGATRIFRGQMYLTY